MITLSPEFFDLHTALAGEYSLERELGRGGMGVVYLARDVQLDRHVAIKVLPLHLAEQPETRERFLREKRTAGGLSHPHVVPIHRVGEASVFVFFVMSYVAGPTLGARSTHRIRARRGGEQSVQGAPQRISSAAEQSTVHRRVAALEGIRLDLLRLHPWATDLMPRTTLLDAAKLLGEDLNRLTSAS